MIRMPPARPHPTNASPSSRKCEALNDSPVFSFLTSHPHFQIPTRGPLHILACTLGDDAQVHPLDVHKLTAIRLLDARRIQSAGFDFQAYATGDLAFASHGRIRVKLRFDGDAGAYLRDALLSDDQTWSECDEPEEGILEDMTRGLVAPGPPNQQEHGPY